MRRWLRAGAALGLLALASPAAARVEVRAGVALPAEHPVVAAGWQAFQDAASAASDGRLQFRLFVNGAVIGSKGALAPLSQGQADMGFVAPANHPVKFPHAAFLTELAMVGEDGLAAAAAMTELMLLHCQRCMEEFLDQNLVFLGTYSAAPYMLIAAAPLGEAGSLRGRRIATPGSLWDRWVQAMGALPVDSERPPADSLAAGEADAVVDVPMALRAKPLGEIARAVTLVPLGAYRGASPFTVNRDFWGKLAEADRAALLASAAAGIVAATIAYEAEARAALQEATLRGAAILDPSADLLALVRRFAEADSSRAAASAGERLRIAEAAEVLETYRSLYGKFVTLLGQLHEPGEAVAVLNGEIFGKLDPARYAVGEARKSRQAAR